ncbi:hypothetical protein ACTFIR_002852 [Dictyostelium discoideum]
MSKRINNKKRKHREYEKELEPENEDKHGNQDENQNDEFLEDKNKNKDKNKDMNKNKNKDMNKNTNKNMNKNNNKKKKENGNENENVLNSQFYKNIKENRQITDIFKTLVECINNKIESLEDDEENNNQDNKNFIYVCEKLREQFIKIYEKEIIEYKLFREIQALTILKERELYDTLKESNKRLALFREYQSNCLKAKCDVDSQMLSIERKEELNEYLYYDNDLIPENSNSTTTTTTTKQSKKKAKASMLTLIGKANFNTNFPSNFDRLFSISSERD